MIQYNDNKLEITIPVGGFHELHYFQTGLLGLLSEIEIETCSEALQEHIKSVYILLGHLMLDSQFLNQYEFLVKEYKELIVKCADGRVREE